jgi:urease accessory protein
MTPVLAHLTGAGGLLDGLGHPFSGLDHLVAMLLVGVLATQARDRLPIWVLPTTFLGAMAVGGGVGLVQPVHATPVEATIAAGLVALAGAVVIAGRLGGAPLVGMVAAIAVAHGLAHGAEVPDTASPLLYVVGFLAATAAAHTVGAALGRVAVATRLTGAGRPAHP